MYLIYLFLFLFFRMEKGDLMPTNWNEIAYRMSDVLVRVNNTAKTRRIIITVPAEIKCSTLAGTGNGKSNSSFLSNAYIDAICISK